MKKTYINPETITVRLMPTAILASSPDVTIGGGTVGAGDVEVKEEVSTGKNVWDEEW